MKKKTLKEKFESGDYKPLGPLSARTIEKTGKWSANHYARMPFSVEKTDGPYIIDEDGNMAVDYLAGYSAILYHGNPNVVRNLEAYLDRPIDLVGGVFPTRGYADLCEKICNLTGFDKVLFKSDGVSVTDTAVKKLFEHGYRQGKGNPEVILVKNYFHGRSIIFSSNAVFDEGQVGFLKKRFPENIVLVPYDPDAYRKAINRNTVGSFMETHQGEAGPLFSKKDSFMEIRKTAKEAGIFFGLDEIQTGLGRCGHIMAWEEYGKDARPDFVTLGKALGAGIIPVSALIGSNEFMEIIEPGTEGSTYGGYPLACAVANSALDYIVKNEIGKKAINLGNYITSKLKNFGISSENRGALIRLNLPGVETTKYACYEMLLGEREPRVFMKDGHSEGGVAYVRIAPVIGAMANKLDLIDETIEKTISPVIEQAIQEGKNFH